MSFAKNLFFILITILLGEVSFGLESKSKHPHLQLIEENFPKRLSEWKYEDSDPDQIREPLSLKTDTLRYNNKEIKLISSSKKPHLVVLYQAVIDTKTIACELRAIDLATSKISLPTKLNDEDELNGCDEITPQDLDGDRNPEIIVTTTDEFGSNAEKYFFKWDEEKFVDITPWKINNSAMNAPQVTDVKVGKSNLIIDSPRVWYLHGVEQGLTGDSIYRTYLVENAKMQMTGYYSFFDVVTKEPGDRAKLVTLETRFVTAGSFILQIKNHSPHSKAVRAEVFVNGKLVLKSQDFCKSAPKLQTKLVVQGDDDFNEDKMKGCAQKTDVSAVITTKDRPEIKVRLFGPGGSAVSVSLKRK